MGRDRSRSKDRSRTPSLRTGAPVCGPWARFLSCPDRANSQTEDVEPKMESRPEVATNLSSRSCKDRSRSPCRARVDRLGLQEAHAQPLPATETRTMPESDHELMLERFLTMITIGAPPGRWDVAEKPEREPDGKVPPGVWDVVEKPECELDGKAPPGVWDVAEKPECGVDGKVPPGVLDVAEKPECGLNGKSAGTSGKSRRSSFGGA